MRNLGAMVEEEKGKNCLMSGECGEGTEDAEGRDGTKPQRHNSTQQQRERERKEKLSLFLSPLPCHAMAMGMGWDGMAGGCASVGWVPLAFLVSKAVDEGIRSSLAISIILVIVKGGASQCMV